ncbi:MAG: hypothetical protein IPO63_09600 [Bacteroidetes bacterium]|nr:hypothetical protein [Bacteroidota bacterium]
MLVEPNVKIEILFSMGKVLLLNSFKSISFLALTLVFLLKFGTLSWGQISVYYLSLLILQHITLFSFETFCQHSILENPSKTNIIWRDAIRVRLSIAYLLIAILALFKIPLTLLLLATCYLILQIYNESYKVIAKLENKINSWNLISWISLIVTIGWILFTKNQLSFRELLILLVASQGIRFAFLCTYFYSIYPLPFFPRTDFTQLKKSGVYFFRSSIVLLNNKTPFLIGAILLGSISMSSFHMILLWTYTGCAMVHLLGTSGILTFTECNRDAIKEYVLKMVIGGTAMGLTWVGICLVFMNKFQMNSISIWWMIPVFILLLFTTIQLPLLYALLKVKEEKNILRIFAACVILQTLLGYWFLSQQEIVLCLWILGATTVLQTLLYMKVLNRII